MAMGREVDPTARQAEAAGQAESEENTPAFQLTKYVSHDLSPVNFAGSTDRFLDALFVAQAMTTDPRQRAKMVHDFERHALTEAYTVPLLWWNRIVATSSKLRGWSITPSHFLGQDLTEVWIDR
jgi:peptide/nickel transport system substrate-binding protein